MYARASKTRAVRSSLAVLLRIAVLFALTILFLLPSSKSAIISSVAHRAIGNKLQANLNQTIHSTSEEQAHRSTAPLF